VATLIVSFGRGPRHSASSVDLMLSPICAKYSVMIADSVLAPALGERVAAHGNLALDSLCQLAGLGQRELGLEVHSPQLVLVPIIEHKRLMAIGRDGEPETFGVFIPIDYASLGWSRWVGDEGLGELAAHGVPQSGRLNTNSAGLG
jgi:hypothetical protein